MEYPRLFDYTYANASNPVPCFWGKDESGNWYGYNTTEVIEHAEKLVGGLLDLGLERGDKVAIVSYLNSPEWAIVDLACQIGGFVSVPLYPTISSFEYAYILEQAEVKVAFCGPGDLRQKLEEASVASVQHIYSLAPDGQPYWKDILKNTDKIEELKSQVDSEDLFTLIYTSGTTGKPKGVMLNHRNISFIIESIHADLPYREGEKVLSFLPLCHVYERAVYHTFIQKRVQVYFTGTDNLGGPDGDIAFVKPVFFSTVPRLLEKVYEAIYNKGLELTGIKKSLFFWALKQAENYEQGDKPGLKMKIADALIFKKWREALGGNIKMIFTAAAACPLKIATIFCAAGIPVREGYGLTETAPTLTISDLDNYLLGAVGYIIDGVELKIDKDAGQYAPDEGEILAHGPNVMIGYYKNPKATSETIIEIDGKKWLRTGDVGKLVPGKNGKTFLKITDRKKELFKTSGGKYVAPTPIESSLKESFFVEQAMLIGNDRKFVSALIVPTFPTLEKWAKEKGVSYSNSKDLIANAKVQALFESIIKDKNKAFNHVEQVKKFKLLSGEWLPLHENGEAAELTPTMKLKRKVILEKYRGEIESMYS